MRRTWLVGVCLALLGASAAPAVAAGQALMRPAKPVPPVLLVHGIDDTEAIFDHMREVLVSAGRKQVYALDMVPNNGDRSLRELAMQVGKKVEAVRAETGAERVDLVGFSMGAMVSRYYIQRLGGVERVRRYVSLAAPHHGTIAAYFRWNAGAAEMRPYSQFLAELDESAEVLQRIEVYSIWTPFDMMIMPAFSSRLPGARERLVPVLAHPLMVQDDRAVQAVVEALL